MMVAEIYTLSADQVDEVDSAERNVFTASQAAQ